MSQHKGAKGSVERASVQKEESGELPWERMQPFRFYEPTPYGKRIEKIRRQIEVGSI